MTGEARQRARFGWAAVLALLVSGRALAAQAMIGHFPVVEVPPENPLTTDKVLLGKALFFEEQLSSDDTMACATCHMSEAGGADPRAGLRNAGADGVLNTADDEFGSPGVVRQDVNGDFRAHDLFGVERQPTARNAPSVLDAAFFNTQFWDSRALATFLDLAGNVVIPDFASLESQAVQPIVSGVEMGHEGRTWDEVTTKLARVRPLDLAHDLPQPLARFVEGSDDYGPLFRRAFGTRTITRERIAMAIASYERTLVTDEAPFDTGTMTLRQKRGFEVFQNAVGFCAGCHPSGNGLFTVGVMTSIGLPGHLRAVKTPGLRNLALRKRFMSSGQFTSLDEVVTHYENIGFISFANVRQRVALLDFLTNALTDPRAAALQPPFDRPLLHSELEPHDARLFGLANAGSSGREPALLADTPANLGSTSFHIGLGDALAGAPAVLLLSNAPSLPGTNVRGIPLAVELTGSTHVPVVLASDGVATYHVEVPADPAIIGRHIYAQWLVLDPSATGGIAVSRAADYQVFSRVFLHKTRL